jgi:hypothetical protein
LISQPIKVEPTEKNIPETINKLPGENKKSQSQNKKIKEQTPSQNTNTNTNNIVPEKVKATPKEEEDEWTVVKKGKNKPK